MTEDRLRAALEELLDDTQHADHDCGDADCPVAKARAALAAQPAPPAPHRRAHEAWSGGGNVTTTERSVKARAIYAQPAPPALPPADPTLIEGTPENRAWHREHDRRAALVQPAPPAPPVIVKFSADATPEEVETAREQLQALMVPALDRERLARAIYAVSIAHDWANTTDTEDRTEEIADAYEADDA